MAAFRVGRTSSSAHCIQMGYRMGPKKPFSKQWPDMNHSVGPGKQTNLHQDQIKTLVPCFDVPTLVSRSLMHKLMLREALTEEDRERETSRESREEDRTTETKEDRNHRKHKGSIVPNTINKAKSEVNSRPWDTNTRSKRKRQPSESNKGQVSIKTTDPEKQS